LAGKNLSSSSRFAVCLLDPLRFDPHKFDRLLGACAGTTKNE